MSLLTCQALWVQGPPFVLCPACTCEVSKVDCDVVWAPLHLGTLSADGASPGGL